MNARIVRMAAAIAIAVVGLMLAGCGSLLPGTKDVNVNTLGRDYYNQPNTAQVLNLEGDSVEISIKGAKKLTLSCPVPTKNMIPQSPGVLDSIGGLFNQVVPWIAGAYIGGKLADRPATVQPAVVEQQVLVPIESAAAP